MAFKTYVKLWFVFTLIVVYEHLSLKFFPDKSIILFLKFQGLLSEEQFPSSALLKTFNYYLGWAGFGLMVVMNFYIFRKRLSFLQKLGKLNDWLNLHIFFGMLGPTFIIFHSDFKVRGIVAISFWSMVVSASSGFIGRYFFINTAKKQKELKDLSDGLLIDIKNKLKDGPDKERILEDLKQRSLDYMGVSSFGSRISFFSLPWFTLSSLSGDLKIFFKRPVLKKYPNGSLDKLLKKYAVARRNEVYADTYRRLLSYWHNFHLPFAVFMYITAVIHIISSLMFRV